MQHIPNAIKNYYCGNNNGNNNTNNNNKNNNKCNKNNKGKESSSDLCTDDDICETVTTYNKLSSFLKCR